jgi:hypothetical protein
MTTSLGILLTRWTIRAALVCYVVYLAAEFVLPRALSARKRRLIWTLGCVLFDVHVACAFHFFHHWSHAAAWQNTAERTSELLGVAIGTGVYFSYAFLVLWWCDVVWLWWGAHAFPRSAPERLSSSAGGAPFVTCASKSRGDTLAAAQAEASSRSLRATSVPEAENRTGRQPTWRLALHGYLLFIALNGAIVFEDGPTRVAGIAACLTLGGLLAGRLVHDA